MKLKMNPKTKEICLVALIVFVVIDVVACVVLLSLDILGMFIPRQYVTTDLNDYGHYVGNNDNRFAQTFIPSFFPEEIEENFENVKYSYRAQKGDTYAFEAYLEFEIADDETFEAYVRDKIGDDVTCFPYDSDFKECVLSDDFELVGEDGVEFAQIGKILYSEGSHKLIYVAVGVYDGGFVRTDFLCVYFNRFGIEPAHYEIGRNPFEQQGSEEQRTGTILLAPGVTPLPTAPRSSSIPRARCCINTQNRPLSCRVIMQCMLI